MGEAPFVILALQSAFGLYGAIYITTAICAPRWFINTVAVNHIKRRYGNHPKRADWMAVSDHWYTWPAILLTMIAVGVIVYAAIHAVVAVVPYDWGSHNEDGDWESIRGGVQGMGAFVGSIFLVSKLEENAEALVWGPIERKARQAIMKGLDDEYGISSKARGRIASRAADGFKRSDCDSGSRKDYKVALEDELHLQLHRLAEPKN